MLKNLTFSQTDENFYIVFNLPCKLEVIRDNIFRKLIRIKFNQSNELIYNNLLQFFFKYSLFIIDKQ